jgi:hypothetical protein
LSSLLIFAQHSTTSWTLDVHRYRRIVSPTFRNISTPKRVRRESTSPPASPSLLQKRPTSTRPVAAAGQSPPNIPGLRQGSHGSIGSRGSQASQHPPPVLPPPSTILSPSASLPSLPPIGTASTTSSGAPGWASAWAANIRERGESRDTRDIRDIRERDYRDSREARDYREGRDIRSPSTAGSPGLEEESTSTEAGMVFARDTSNRAPRSMMACTRCRRQK